MIAWYPRVGHRLRTFDWRAPDEPAYDVSIPPGARLLDARNGRALLGELDDLVRRAGSDLPAGQRGREIGPGHLRGVACPAEQHPHGSAATSSRTGLRLPV